MCSRDVEGAVPYQHDPNLPDKQKFIFQKANAVPLASKKINLDKLVTHRFKLDDIDKAFDLYRNKEKSLIKAVIEF